MAEYLSYETKTDTDGTGERAKSVLNRFAVENRGRQRSCVRVLIVAGMLFLIQIPLQGVAEGSWTSEATRSTGEPLSAQVAVRLSLVFDFALIGTYVLAAYRAVQLVWARRAPRVFRGFAYAGFWSIAVGAALGIVENSILWSRSDHGLDATGFDFTVGRSIWKFDGIISVATLGFVGLGLVVVTATWIASHPGRWWKVTSDGIHERKLGKWANKRANTDRGPTRGAAYYRWRELLGEGEMETKKFETNGSVICLSGGGIRAASFCLGGLQALAEAGVYQKSRSVVGVSGGGYIGAALHISRWQSGDSPAEKWSHQEPFLDNGPEVQWLRRKSQYLMDSSVAASQGALSLLFGVAVNLILITIALGALAWGAAWVFLTSGRLRADVITTSSHPRYAGDPTAGVPLGGDFSSGWVPLSYVWMIPLAAGALFVLERVISRLVTFPYYRPRILLARSEYYLLSGGTVILMLFLGLPKVIEILRTFAQTSAHPLAGLLYQLGFVSQETCTELLNHGNACGISSSMSQPPDVGAATVATVSLATIISAVLAVLAAATGDPSRKVLDGRVRARLSKVWALVKKHVVPWSAAALIGAVILVFLLAWTASWTANPEALSRWKYMYVAGGLLLFVQLGTEANRTSLHHFFRERISFAFMVRVVRGNVAPMPFKEVLRFSESKPPPGAGPNLVACAVANVSDRDVVPAKRGCSPFIFDDEWIGLTDQFLPNRARRRECTTYEFAADHRYRDATIPAAVAMSGAAFSPLAGRENVRIGPFRAVLALANARLGVWLPNPIWIDEAGIVKRMVKLRRDGDLPAVWADLPRTEADHLLRSINARDRSWLRDVVRGGEEQDAAEEEEEENAALFDLYEVGESQSDGGPRVKRYYEVRDFLREFFEKPGVANLAREAFGRTSIYDQSLYITDGGHYDNLGLVEALRRKPATIYALDASNDVEDTFKALGRAITTARMDLDCEVKIDPRGMRRLLGERSPTAWCTGKATYADGSSATIFLAKAVAVDHLTWDLETYKSDNSDFPRTSTTRQQYGEFDFEAYRMLGNQVTKGLLDSREHRVALYLSNEA